MAQKLVAKLVMNSHGQLMRLTRAVGRSHEENRRKKDWVNRVGIEGWLMHKGICNIEARKEEITVAL